MRGNRPAEPAAAAYGSVVVARSDIEAGALIPRLSLGVREVPRAELPRQAMTVPGEVVGRVAARRIHPGEIIRSEDVLEPDVSLGLRYALPPELRAVTVSTDQSAGIAGMLRPADHVDVLATFTRGSESSTRVILQDVEVIAVDNDVSPEPTPASERQSTASTSRDVPVTLAVTVSEAERLVLADTRGKIRLALRPATGGAFDPGRGVTESALSGLRNPAPGAPRSTPIRIVPQPAPAGSGYAAVPAAASGEPRTKPKPAAVLPAKQAPASVPEAQEPEITVHRGTRTEVIRVPAPPPAAGAVDLESAKGRPYAETAAAPSSSSSSSLSDPD